MGELTGTNIYAENIEVLAEKTDGKGNGSGTTEPSSTVNGTTGKESLPKTGSKYNNILIVIGILVILLSVLLYTKLKKH